MCTSFRLRVPARRALHPATPSTGQFPHQSTRILPARPRLTHLRTHSWAWAGTFRRPSLRVTQRHYSGLSLLLEAAQDPTLNCFCLFVCLTAKGPRRNLRNDLLIAADSITNTMSSLVKELNSGKDEWRENSSHIQTYYTLTVFIIFFLINRGWKWNGEHCGFRFWTWTTGHKLLRSFLRLQTKVLLRYCKSSHVIKSTQSFFVKPYHEDIRKRCWR